jgi:hypothetical protein
MRAVVEDGRHDGQDMRARRPHDERLDEVEAFDAPALGAEPAGGGEGVEVEGGDRRGDGRPIDGDG